MSLLATIYLCFGAPRSFLTLIFHFYVDRSYYENGLLRSQGFFLDLGADSGWPSDIDVQYSYRRNPQLRPQYIHRSGTLLVSILGDRQGLACVANRIYLSHSPEAGSKNPRDRLVELCGNIKALRKIWDDLANEADRLERHTKENEVMEASENQSKQS